MKDVKIGIVGLNLGQWHIETIAELEDAVVAAVADNAPKIKVPPYGGGKQMTVVEYAKSIGANGYDDGVVMIESEDLDALSLCISPKYREPLLKAAAKKKVPVLMEKPMAGCLKQARQFAKIASDVGMMFMMEYPLRYFPVMERLKYSTMAHWESR